MAKKGKDKTRKDYNKKPFSVKDASAKKEKVKGDKPAAAGNDKKVAEERKPEPLVFNLNPISGKNALLLHHSCFYPAITKRMIVSSWDTFRMELIRTCSIVQTTVVTAPG